jgi:hypothetical protein
VKAQRRPAVECERGSFGVPMGADSHGNIPHGRFETYIDAYFALQVRAWRLCVCQNQR